MLMHPFSVFSRAKVRSIRKAKDILMHRKNNQGAIIKPIKGHNKANWFWRIKKTLRIIRVTTWVTRIFYSKSVLGFGINQHSQSLLFISCFATAMFTLRKYHVYASQLPCLCFASTMFMLHECHVYNIQMMMFWLTNMLCKEWKNVKTRAFLPRFCINIQNDRKIANKALSFQNVRINS